MSADSVWEFCQICVCITHVPGVFSLNWLCPCAYSTVYQAVNNPEYALKNFQSAEIIDEANPKIRIVHQSMWKLKYLKRITLVPWKKRKKKLHMLTNNMPRKCKMNY
jgi:hypothetical protein